MTFLFSAYLDKQPWIYSSCVGGGLVGKINTILNIIFTAKKYKFVAIHYIQKFYSVYTIKFEFFYNFSEQFFYNFWAGKLTGRLVQL